MPVDGIWWCSPGLAELSSLELVRQRGSPSCRWLQYMHFDAGNYCLEEGFLSKEKRPSIHLFSCRIIAAQFPLQLGVFAYKHGPSHTPAVVTATLGISRKLLFCKNASSLH